MFPFLLYDFVLAIILKLNEKEVLLSFNHRKYVGSAVSVFNISESHSEMVEAKSKFNV